MNFSRDDVCFTYPDSLYEVPLDDLGRLYLERDAGPTVIESGMIDPWNRTPKSDTG
jgi:hypothetical protein